MSKTALIDADKRYFNAWQAQLNRHAQPDAADGGLVGAVSFR